MAKNLVFCADGTWNGPGQEEGDDARDDPVSNVFRLYLGLGGDDATDPANFRAADEQERVLADSGGTVRQVAKYLHGVGDSGNFLVKALGGALGAGLIARIVRGYTFLSRNYVPGDRLFIVGFSRGAYTARALAGLVGARGLIDARAHDLSDKAEAYRLGSAVWADYRCACVSSRPERGWEARMESVLDHLPRFFGAATRVQRVPDVPIDTVAVWDTVGALGIPEYQADHCRLDVFRFCDTTLGPKVGHGIHAVAVDEQRADFTPTLWDEDPKDPGRIVQVAFPGAHADVGGGYPRTDDESGLSDGALSWMMDRLREREVIFRGPRQAALAPDPLGTAHQPWRQMPWTFAPTALRGQVKGLQRHPSFAARLGRQVMADPSAPGRTVYDPPNMH